MTDKKPSHESNPFGKLTEFLRADIESLNIGTAANEPTVAAIEFPDPLKGYNEEKLDAEGDRKKAFADRHEKLKLDQHELDVEAQKDLQEARKTYTEKVFYLLTVWLVCVGGILFFNMVKMPWLESVISFELSDTVLLGIIGGTTANVIGMFVIVLKYLFPSTAKPKS